MNVLVKTYRYLRAFLNNNNSSRRMSPVNVAQQRYDALDRAMLNVLVGTRVESEARADASRKDAHSLIGHYAEFGVYRGESFAHVARRGSDTMPWMHFYAFDSFEGLPPMQGLDHGGEFIAGQFSCSREQFESYLKWRKVDMDRVHVVPGWFNDTLTDEMAGREGLDVVSVAFIDCDLYESCVPVLEFLSNRLRQGSILLYDDWYNFRADPRRGVRRATEEWLTKQDRYTLEPWFSFCHHGKAFIVLDRECPIEGQAQ